ncbi:MAG TPA: acyl-CoA dehydrogenase family protein, partial [Castellaniella sp.]|nr:acyl-CoA dehydrogenase family protein [Castellaniella sp.]
GFCALYAPESIGGLGLSRLDATMVFEEMAAYDPSTTAFITIHNMATWMIGSWAQPAIRDHWGPLLASGEKLASYCLTEPNAGSDAASLVTRAERDGPNYVINGAKAFISGAGDTDLLVVMARTGGPGARGISAFAVPGDTPGIQYGRKEKKMGWNSQSTRPITFDQVLIPEDHRLGDEGEGFKFAMKGLDGGRINIATCSVGAAQGAYDAARRYMSERRQFGRPLADFQALQFKLADMLTHIVASRQMVRLAAAKLDEGSPQASAYCAMAKRLATDLCFQVCLDAQQIHGGYGYLKDYPLERLVRDTRVHQILEGTNEIMRLIVARQVLETGADLR